MATWLRVPRLLLVGGSRPMSSIKQPKPQVVTKPARFFSWWSTARGVKMSSFLMVGGSISAALYQVAALVAEFIIPPTGPRSLRSRIQSFWNTRVGIQSFWDTRIRIQSFWDTRIRI